MGRSRPVPACLAVMLNDPCASIWKATSIVGSPGAAGGISVTSNRPRHFLKTVNGSLPCKGVILIDVWAGSVAVQGLQGVDEDLGVVLALVDRLGRGVEVEEGGDGGLG